MSAGFEEIDRRMTRIGEISLRRRYELSFEVDVYEVKLGDEFLMSSLFTASEIALANLGLAQASGDALDVVVGGLGLGYTAHAALEHARVRSLQVVEALGEVIGWHERLLLPLSAEITSDPRCTLVEGDFFARVAAGEGFAPGAPTLFDAVLVDIDHTPRHLLDSSHAPFYEPEGLRRLAAQLRPGGVFGLWSDDPPDADFLRVVDDVFETHESHVVTFPNPYTGDESSNTVYVATVGAS